MEEQRTYYFELEGHVDEIGVNSNGPSRIKIEYTDQRITQLSIRTDQSGAVGFLRYLHGLGFSLIALHRRPGIILSKVGRRC